MTILPLVNCVWNDWQIGECSKTCAGGKRTNSRTKKVQEAHGGTCTGKDNFEEECNTQKCPRTYKTVKLVFLQYVLFEYKVQKKL